MTHVVIVAFSRLPNITELTSVLDQTTCKFVLHITRMAKGCERIVEYMIIEGMLLV
jgi:hypothetical protein